MAILLSKYLERIERTRVQNMRAAILRTIFYGSSGPLVEKLKSSTYSIRDLEVIPYGEMKIIGDNTGKGVKMTDFDATTAEVFAKTAAIGYEVSDERLERIDPSGINIRDLAGVANANIAEKWLESVNLIGNAQYGFKGLFTNSSVTTVTPVTKAATGLLWANATMEEMITDMLNLAQGVETNSFGTWFGRTLCLPDANFKKATNSVHQYSGKSAIALAKERDPRIERIIPVSSHMNGIGAGATNRACAFDNNPFVVQMTEMGFQTKQTLRVELGWKVIEVDRTAGCLFNDLQGVAYMDGI